MWDIPRLYVTACSNSVQLVPLQPIDMTILFNHYKKLKGCISDVGQIDASGATDSSNKKIDWLTIREEKVEEKQEEREEMPATLDGFII